MQLYRKSSITPPWGASIFHTNLGGLNRDRGLFNLTKTMISVLHNGLEYKVKKLNYKKLEVTQPRVKKHLRTSRVNKPSRISPYEILLSWLMIDTAVYHLSVKNNNKGEGREGLKEREAYHLFSPERGEGWLFREGELNRGFTICSFKITRHLFYMILFFSIKD